MCERAIRVKVGGKRGEEEEEEEEEEVRIGQASKRQITQSGLFQIQTATNKKTQNHLIKRE